LKHFRPIGRISLTEWDVVFRGKWDPNPSIIPYTRRWVGFVQMNRQFRRIFDKYRSSTFALLWLAKIDDARLERMKWSSGQLKELEQVRKW